MHGLTATVNCKFQRQMKRPSKKEQEFVRYSWSLLDMTSAAIRNPTHNNENESHGKHIEEKTYSIKSTDGIIRDDVINAFLLGGYRGVTSSFSTSAIISMIMLQNDLLMKSFITYYSLEDDYGIPTNFVWICVELVSVINQTISDSLENNVRPLGKDTRGR
jgi:hypothetical protein